MIYSMPKDTSYGPITRRNFLKTASVFTAGLVMGCAVNPVTGERQFMLVSEDSEIKIDRENSPQQFSSDYGRIQDKQLSNYISRTGKNMAKLTHRPDLPYSFQGVNATYVNAYAFPEAASESPGGFFYLLKMKLSLVLSSGMNSAISTHAIRRDRCQIPC